jgi:flagellar basal body-associated protein FliL
MSGIVEKSARSTGAPPRKNSLNLAALLLPPILAGGAAFGGARLAAAHAASAASSASAAPAVEPPPGPTVALDPFLVLTQDTNRKSHPMKLTVAVEFEANAKEESLKNFTPRMRDATLSYLRTLTYEDALDNGKADRLRADLLERFRSAGVTSVQRVLMTDLVLQ